MMWDLEPRRILVGIEKDDSDAALAYAAREARMRRCGVHLMHVVPMVVGGVTPPEKLDLINGELHDHARRVVGDAAVTLEHLLDGEDLPVSTEICHGPVVPTLVDQSRHAALVVVQHRGMGPDGHPPVLSVTTGLAGHAHAPVVAVPDAWRVPESGPRRSVTVVLGPNGSGDPLVDAAADQAVLLGATLRIVHDETVDELLDRASETALYVVGRRHPRWRLGAHLDHPAHVLLRHSPVPVMVLDPDDRGAPEERGDPDDPEVQREVFSSVVP
jgi:nucleotide-binding universal stress UspA family protein